jgi:hypothetical protein
MDNLLDPLPDLGNELHPVRRQPPRGDQALERLDDLAQRRRVSR